MLVLTHGSPAHEAQRRTFKVLHDFGLGAQERRGLVVLGDGFERFGPIAGVVCTPEAMAVIAAHEITGADGYLFAPLRGGWTIGGRPALVDGSGTNPVPQVDAAAKQIVAAARRGGLDPGYVQAILVLDGPITGIAQPETQRGGGVAIVPLSPEGLRQAVDVASTNREPGLASIWTTADVIELLQVLGFDARDLDVQLLTAEGFPYSPYVLRPTSTDDVPFSRPESTPRATRALRHLSDRPGGLSIASVLGAAAGDQRPTGPVPQVTPPLRAAPVEAPPPTGPAALLVDPEHEPEPRRSPWRWLVPLLALAVLVAAIWIGATTLLGDADKPDADTVPSSAAEGDGPPAGGSESDPSEPGPQEAGGYTFQQTAADQVQDCASHAFGQAGDFLAEHACTSMERAIYLTTVDGKQVVISLAEVQMPDAGSAAELKALLDTEGTGNVNDLLRENKAPEGSPPKEVLGDSEYASSVDGEQVRIVLAAYADGAAPTAKVDAAADAALALKISPR
ncbi:hypothetical protein [Blastococcus sp. Marseille-P5729]|uniref:hypothetical protein n=1 Tax=Blastococcus sp. Marseille-P5729 TaxID=2086582 RepID=UPI000D0F665D|nr:hypothetical protein [Blastococcus sp. Marseille-P5729]